MQSTSTTPSGSSFHGEVTEAATAVRDAFAALIGALPPTNRPADLSRLLGIDYTMSRRASRLAEATDAVLVATEIPRPAAMPRIVKASARKGVDRAILARLEEAVDRYESLAVRHGGDRATFDAMIAAFSPEAAERNGLEAKRAAYRANVQLLGRQVDTTAFFIAVRPSAQREDYTESLWLCSQFGLKRFLPRVPLEIISTRFLLAREGGDVEWPTRAFPNDGPYDSGSFLIPEFCTNPLPGLKPLPEQTEGFRRFEFDSEEIGRRSAIDCVTGQYVHAPRPQATASGRRLFGLHASLDIPTETLLIDVFVHDSLAALPSPICHSLTPSFPLPSIVPEDPDPTLLLPLQESAQVIGRGPLAARTKEVPHFDGLIRHAFAKMGWSDPEAHQLVRCRVEYPILNAHYALRVPI